MASLQGITDYQQNNGKGSLTWIKKAFLSLSLLMLTAVPLSLSLSVNKANATAYYPPACSNVTNTGYFADAKSAILAINATYIDFTSSNMSYAVYVDSAGLELWAVPSDQQFEVTVITGPTTYLGTMSNGYGGASVSTIYHMNADGSYHYAAENKPVNAGNPNGPVSCLAIYGHKTIDGGEAATANLNQYFPYVTDSSIVTGPKFLMSDGSEPPVAPTTAPVLSGTAGTLENTLNWTAISGASQYKLYQGTSLIYTGAALTYTQTGLTAGTAYAYTVKASNVSGDGPASNEVTLTPTAGSSGGGSTPTDITPRDAKLIGIFCALFMAWWSIKFFIYRGNE